MRLEQVEAFRRAKKERMRDVMGRPVCVHPDRVKKPEMARAVGEEAEKPETASSIS